MANPLQFKPTPVEPRTEHEHRLATAPSEHAEALLVAWDVLQAAHDQGLLDAVHGLIGAKDTVAAKFAEYARQPEGIAGIRNLLAAAKVLTALDPETLDHLAKIIVATSHEHKQERTPPSLWQLAKRANSEDSRRGLSFLTLLLSGLGKSLKS